MPHVTIDGCRIHYRFDGREDAPVLLVSNSLGTDMGMWEPQIPAFTSRFRVLRYDSRGHGRSDAPPGPYAIDRLGRDALGLLDALDLRRVRFCGLSKGGMIGMWLGTNAADRIERLVLCNTSTHLGPPSLWEDRIRAVRAGGMAAIADTVLERWFTAAFRASAPEKVAPVRRMLLATPPEGYVGCCGAIRDMDQSETIRAIRAPTLVVAGEHDPATPPTHGALIAERIAGARLVTLAAAHLSNIEAASAFDDAVLGFLSD
jgi:3-oxoadipate enol-lactonase